MSVTACPSCGEAVVSDSRFCRSCGEPVEVSAMTTGAGLGLASPRVHRLISSDSVPAGGFTPGTVLAGRHRVVGLLGRGGMGEVYRADDLKVGQPIALKFLPASLADDPVRRERFFADVRITRQISHPNICRVYDIGELDEGSRGVDVSQPVALFKARMNDLANVNGQQYDVSRDGNRFLLNTITEQNAPPITLIVNWHPH